MLLIDWLLEGDISIQYLASRDLLPNTPEHKLRAIRRKLAMEGWVKHILDIRRTPGGWGNWFEPRWTGGYHTLRTLIALAVPPDNPDFLDAVEGLSNALKPLPQNDDCLLAGCLDILAYAGRDDEITRKILDTLLTAHRGAEGLSCGDNRSSLPRYHALIAFLEGLNRYQRTGSAYRQSDITAAIESGTNELIRHRLMYRESGAADPQLQSLSFPVRDRYDILRGLEFLVEISQPRVPELDDALGVILAAQEPGGTWHTGHRHPGTDHLDMETQDRPGRMVTYRVLTVLQHFLPEVYLSIFREDYREAGD